MLFGAAAAAVPFVLLLAPPSIVKPLFSSYSLEERGSGWSSTISSLFVHPLGKVWAQQDPRQQRRRKQRNRCSTR